MNITKIRMRAAAVLVFGGLGAWVLYGALADTMEMDPEKYAALKAFADRRLSETKVPGVGVGIIKDGKVIFAGGFGTRDLNTGEPVNSQTAYLIGSSTKPFTVTAIAILAEEGVLDWDERVQTYMPSFKFKDEYVSEHLTLRDLGSHRSGVVDEPEWMGSTLSRGEMIESMSDFEQSFGFREKFEYNGSGFMILGHMATLASKTKFEDVVIERVAKPLGMENTIWSDLSGPNPPYTENVAYPHTVENGKARRIDFQFEGEAIRPRDGTLECFFRSLLLRSYRFHLQSRRIPCRNSTRSIPVRTAGRTRGSAFTCAPATSHLLPRDIPPGDSLWLLELHERAGSFS